MVRIKRIFEEPEGINFPKVVREKIKIDDPSIFPQDYSKVTADRILTDENFKNDIKSRTNEYKKELSKLPKDDKDYILPKKLCKVSDIKTKSFKIKIHNDSYISNKKISYAILSHSAIGDPKKKFEVERTYGKNGTISNYTKKLNEETVKSIEKAKIACEYLKIDYL
jgi:hypothetical protein